MSCADDLFTADLYRRAEAAARDFLERDWPHYLRRVEKIEAHPDNRDGADKSWLFHPSRSWRRLARSAERVR